MSNCTSGCPTPGAHATWGDCMRSKRQMINGCREAAGFDTTAMKKFDADLEAYRSARYMGIQPDKTTRAAVDFAVRASERKGMGYGTEFNVIPRENGKLAAVTKKEQAEVLAAVDAHTDHEAVMKQGAAERKGKGLI